MSTKQENPFWRFASECDEARKALRGHMVRHGLGEDSGWRIYEFTREVDGRTELVMRPVHSHLNPPSKLECKCTIHQEELTVSHGCQDD
jgi:hypothetical protein